MSKIKTLKSAAKRFKKTSNGFKHKQSFKSHILTKKSSKRKRQLRNLKLVKPQDQKLVEKMMPYA